LLKHKKGTFDVDGKVVLEKCFVDTIEFTWATYSGIEEEDIQSIGPTTNVFSQASNLGNVSQIGAKCLGLFTQSRRSLPEALSLLAANGNSSAFGDHQARCCESYAGRTADYECGFAR